jgi:hypothetical protein
MCTPPLLERLAQRDDLVELVRRKVQAIQWTGAHMDADTRSLYRTEVFPDIVLYGLYGSTMILGVAEERLGLGDDDPCVFNPPSPYITFTDSISHGGGTWCTNTTAVFVEGDPGAVADAIAQRLATLPSLRPSTRIVPSHDFERFAALAREGADWDTVRRATAETRRTT